jgi:hypothetical protein
MKSEIPPRIERSDIEALPVKVGGTEIVLQRHGQYERSADTSNVGSLTEEGVENVRGTGFRFFKSFFENIPASERADVEVLVIASDTQHKERGKRSTETADTVMGALREVLSELGLNESQILNTSGRFSGEGAARPTPKLREPQMFNNSPEFVEFLKDKYGDQGKDFWIAFEEDVEKEAREAMGAEGPDEITDRLTFMVSALNRFSRMYHKKNPNKRLVIWAGTHYDTISPYVKREVFGVDKDVALGVDYGAGISIEIDPSGKMTTQLGGSEYEIGSKKESL